MSRREVLNLLRKLFVESTYTTYPPGDESGCNGTEHFSYNTFMERLDATLDTEAGCGSDSKVCRKCGYALDVNQFSDGSDKCDGCWK